MDFDGFIAGSLCSLSMFARIAANTPISANTEQFIMNLMARGCSPDSRKAR